MAEFQEVMKQAKRMCDNYNDCTDCPICKKAEEAQTICPVPSVNKIDSANVETVVRDWAAKHPEPKHPSWHEAWKQLFPDGQRTPCPGCCGKKYAPEWCGQEECGVCKNRPIPADIAEKLGIKPVGGEENG